MNNNGQRALVIQNGTLIDSNGGPPVENDAILVEGTRVTSVGTLPGEVDLEDSDAFQVIDAAGQWIMPGLIDSHCHLSFGQPTIPHLNIAKGAISPEFNTIRAAINAQKVLRTGVTSVSIPGGTWFTDVALREAINAGLIEGPRIFCAGQFIVTYGSIGDIEPWWVGTPEHSLGRLANSVSEMITEVRRQTKHGVDFIKMADSTWGDNQTISQQELTAVVDEAHRRNARISIHSRGSGSTMAAARAGVDWIMHADLATEADLYAVAEHNVRIIPTVTFLERAADVGQDYGRGTAELDLINRNLESAAETLQMSRNLGIKVLAGTDTGNSPLMPYGELHANEADILVRHGGYTPMEALLACTRENAYAVGLEDEVGVISPGKLADIIILDQDPLKDIRILQGGRHLTNVIKDGKLVALSGVSPEERIALELTDILN
ncbi:MAG: amidohydrolase family protein [Chloroflexota bacterium]|nr:amidohydrolase family protein [Chloroflexota bacterium]